MESKPISEIAKLKLENVNLKLQLLQVQYQQITQEKMRVIEDEHKLLECPPEEWQFDERNGMLIKKSNKEVVK